MTARTMLNAIVALDTREPLAADIGTFSPVLKYSVSDLVVTSSSQSTVDLSLIHI